MRLLITLLFLTTLVAILTLALLAFIIYRLLLNPFEFSVRRNNEGFTVTWREPGNNTSPVEENPWDVPRPQTPWPPPDNNDWDQDDGWNPQPYEENDNDDLTSDDTETEPQ